MESKATVWQVQPETNTRQDMIDLVLRYDLEEFEKLGEKVGRNKEASKALYEKWMKEANQKA